jgi:hypothetical protein
MRLGRVSNFNRDAALCRLMSGFGVTVVIQGDSCPSTDGKVIVLPPLKIDADEIDIAIHDFGVGHEPSHITEGSFDHTENVSGFRHDIHNWLEDIRCEDSQERTKYPGLRRERGKFYENFHTYASRLGTAKLISTANSLTETIRGGLCFFLLEARCKQLGVKHDVTPTGDVRWFYRYTLAQFLDRAIGAQNVQETLALSTEIYKAIKAFEGLDGSTTLRNLEQNTSPTLSDEVVAEIMLSSGSIKEIPVSTVYSHPANAHLVSETLEEGLKLLGSKGAEMTRALMAFSRPRTVRGKLDGRLDSRAVIGDHLNARQDLYSRRIKGAVGKAAVSFLLDTSGSMSSNCRTMFSLVLGIASYLEKARVPYEVSSFDSYFRPLKKWGEFLKGDVFLKMVPNTSGNTLLGGALWKVARSLMARTEDRKVLFVLCDGSTDDSSAYCKKIVDQMRKSGAVVIGIGIGVDLSHIFGADFINLKMDSIGSYLTTRITQILSRKN